MCWVCLLTFSPRAYGQVRRFVVDRFSGPQSASLRKLLIEDLASLDDVEIVSDQELQAVREQLKIPPSTRDAAQLQALSAALQASALIRGRVQRSRRTWRLGVTVINGKTGKPDKPVPAATWQGSTLQSLHQVRTQGAKRLAAALVATEVADPAALTPDEAEPPARTHEPKEAATPPPTAPPAPNKQKKPQLQAPPSDSPYYRSPESSPKTAPGFDDGDFAARFADDPFALEGGGRREAAGPSTDIFATPPPTDVDASTAAAAGASSSASSSTRSTGARDARWESMRAEFGFGTLYRSLRARAGVFSRYRSPDLDPENNEIIEEERQFSSSGAGNLELGFRIEAYPGAIPNKQVFPWLGLVVGYQRAVDADVPAPADDDAEGFDGKVGSSGSELYLGIKGRTRFNDPRTGPRLFIEAGWGRFDFTLDTNDLEQIDPSTVVPPVSYGYVQLSGGLQFTLSPTYLIGELAVGGRFGVSMGQDMRDIWGVDSQPGNALIGGLRLRSQAPYLFRGAYFAFHLQLLRFVTEFKGQTRCQSDDAAACDEASAGNFPIDWEPWPYPAGDPNAVSEGGGIRGKVADLYIRWSIGFGYAFR